MEDYFEIEMCERCGADLKIRTVSWFKEEVICGDCSLWEEFIIRQHNKSKSDLEGIGTVPTIDQTVHWGSEPPTKT